MSNLMKVTMVGDSNSGKELILDRFVEKGYQDYGAMYVGIRTTILPITVNGQSFKIQILELNEEERFENIRKVYHYGALGGILVFDVMKRDTFNNLENWSKEIWENSGEGVIQLVIFGLNAEKRDQSTNSVTKEEGMKIAATISKAAMKEGYEIPYYEISTEVRKDIEKGLEFLAKAYMDSLNT